MVTRNTHDGTATLAVAALVAAVLEEEHLTCGRMVKDFNFPYSLLTVPMHTRSSSSLRPDRFVIQRLR